MKNGIQARKSRHWGDVDTPLNNIERYANYLGFLHKNRKFIILRIIMGKRSISAKQLVADIKAGKSDAELMESYNVSAAALQSLFKKLVSAGLMRQEEIDNRIPTSERTVNLALWKCPACGMPQSREMDECPDCGIITAKYIDKKTNEIDRSGIAAASGYSNNPSTSFVISSLFSGISLPNKRGLYLVSSVIFVVFILTIFIKISVSTDKDYPNTSKSGMRTKVNPTEPYNNRRTRTSISLNNIDPACKVLENYFQEAQNIIIDSKGIERERRLSRLADRYSPHFSRLPRLAVDSILCSCALLEQYYEHDIELVRDYALIYCNDAVKACNDHSNTRGDSSS